MDQQQQRQQRPQQQQSRIRRGSLAVSKFLGRKVANSDDTKNLGNYQQISQNDSDEVMVNEDAQQYDCSSEMSMSSQQRQRLLGLSQREQLQFIDESLLECDEEAEADAADALSLVRINVSGCRFEILRSTLTRQRHIYDKILHDGVYRSQNQEFYFDRDPAVFRIVLWYCRYGELHVPHHYCGPLLDQELALWGIQAAIEIENCCVSHLMDTKSRLVSLRKFEEFFREEMEDEPVLKPLDPNFDNSDDSLSNSCRNRCSHMLSTIRSKLWKIIDHPTSSMPAAVYAFVLGAVVLYAVFSFVASTSAQFQRNMTPQEVQMYFSRQPKWFGNHTSTMSKVKVDWLIFPDWIAFGVLTFDFAVRFLCCRNKVAFFKNNYTIIDLLSVLPFYVNELLKIYFGIVEFSDSNDFGIAEYIAFVKIALFVRLLRIGRHYRGLQVLIYTLRTSITDLMLMGVFVALGTLLFSTLIFFCEKSRSDQHVSSDKLSPAVLRSARSDKAEAAFDCSICPNSGNNNKFVSMFDGFWWSLVTMTTVGYGDLVPQTNAGKIVGTACALSGLLLIAFTVPIMVNHFMLYYSHSQTVHVSRTSVQEYATKALLAKVNSFAGGQVKKVKQLMVEAPTQKIDKKFLRRHRRRRQKQNQATDAVAKATAAGEKEMPETDL